MSVSPCARRLAGARCDTAAAERHAGRDHTRAIRGRPLWRASAQASASCSYTKLGCSGETTTTMLIRRAVCQYPAGNQLRSGVAFIQTHRGRAHHDHRSAATTSSTASAPARRHRSTACLAVPSCVIRATCGRFSRTLARRRGTDRAHCRRAITTIRSSRRRCCCQPPKGRCSRRTRWCSLKQSERPARSGIYAGFGVKVADVRQALSASRTSRTCPSSTCRGTSFIALTVDLDCARRRLAVQTSTRTPPGYVVMAGAFYKTIGAL